MKNAQIKYNDFFYPYQDLINKKHSRKICNQCIDDDDIRRYRIFVRDCFGLHLDKYPKKLLEKDMKLAPKESNRFFNEKDIRNLFISQIYKYPSMKKYNIDDLSQYDKTIDSNDVFKEILGHIANPNIAVVLLGDVGEGKSTFLKRLVVDLSNFEGDQKYLPIIIDIEGYKSIIEKDNDKEAFEGFWNKVCDDIVLYLESDYKITVATTVSKTSETGMSAEVSFASKLKAIIAELKSAIKINTTEKTSAKSTRSFNIFSQIQNAAKDLYSNNNTRMVLIFDNLDTFCYEHERYMLFPKGFSKLKTKILTVRKIINEVISHLSDSGISFIFTARPYVYYHAFQRQVHEISWTEISAVYYIEPISYSVPMESRLELINMLSEKLLDTNLPEGKKKAVKNHHHIFKSNINKCISHTQYYMQKFYKLSNQGMRSIVEFYKSSDYHPELFERYFSHNILYLYMLGRRELYSQVYPSDCSQRQKYYFPNMFLVMCNNHVNRKHYEEPCKPHKVTYWLKYLILWVCYVSKKISIKELLSIFSDYEDHVVKLCIGSLATVNEYNCLKMEFGYDIDFSMEINDLDNSLKKFEETTYLYPTNRGIYLIENNFCLGFECLQLYIDDWLFPLPKKDILNELDEAIYKTYKPAEKKLSYNYLLSVNGYGSKRKKMIITKARESLLLLRFLEGAFKAEQEQHKKNWEKIKDISGEKSLFNKDAFEILQNKLINDAGTAYGKDEKFKENLKIYNRKLNNYRTHIDELFKRAVGITTSCI